MSVQEPVSQSLREQIEQLVADIRSIQLVAGQCSVEGPRGPLALQAADESERCRRWADRLQQAADRLASLEQFQPIDALTADLSRLLNRAREENAELKAKLASLEQLEKYRGYYHETEQRVKAALGPFYEAISPDLSDAAAGFIAEEAAKLLRYYEDEQKRRSEALEQEKQEREREKSGVLPDAKPVPDAHVERLEADAPVIDNGNTFVFCDYVSEKHMGCVRGAGHNGPHALGLPPHPQGPVILV